MVSTLVFFVNGKKIKEENVNPEWTLLHYLRKKLKLCGTKLGCGEGGCGACTIMVSRYDRFTHKPIHFTVNSCLAPVCSMHGLAVTTIEGIGSTRGRLNATQERIARAHGSQCGFCTPGIVMSMYTLLRNKTKPNWADLETAFQGNLCRCTGYRPILEAFRTFTEQWHDGTNDNLTNGNSNKNNCGLGEACCRNAGTINGNCNRYSNDDKLFHTSDFTPYDPDQEPIFPPELVLNDVYDKQRLIFIGADVTWHRPTTLSELLQLKFFHPNAKIVVGNTEIGVEVKIKRLSYPILIQPTHIKDLSSITQTNMGITIGAAVTLQQLQHGLNRVIGEHPEHMTRIFTQIVYMLKWFAGKQIRNVASVGGNIITCSPISDLNPIFTSAQCELQLASTRGIRIVIMNRDFYTGYRQNILEKDEVLVSITIPFSHENQYFCAFKQAKRRDDDIAIVNTAINVQFVPKSNIIQDIQLSFGGMAPTTVVAPKTRQVLIGKKWNEDMLETAYNALLEDLPLSPSAPGGMIQYRRALTLSLFFKSYLAITEKYNRIINNIPSLSHIEKSEGRDFEFMPLKASQYYSIRPDSQKTTDPIGRPIVHASAFKQATGEAVYCDDMPTFENELYLSLVLSTKSHAKILSIDASEACALPGVHRFFSAKDLTETQNQWGVVIPDEEIFARNTVHCHGQVIGAIVADNQWIAQKATKLVNVKYEDLATIITIEDAISEHSYFPQARQPIIKGDVDEAFKTADHVIQSDVRTSPQEHFYLETQCTLAVPKGEDNEMEIFSSTQNPNLMNRMAANMLSVPINRLVTRVKRIGGAFGGKETRCASLAMPVILAAHKLNRPVRSMLDRDEDMLITGCRHAILFKYKVAFTKEGKITALELDTYLNAGYSLEISAAVLEQTMIQCQNAYLIPNIRVRGYLCKTNLPTFISFRGFGRPQVIFAVETMIRDIAEVLQKDSTQISRMNFLQDGDITHFNQPVENCNMTRCYDECLQMANYSARKIEIDHFNRQNRWRKRGIDVVPLFYGIGFSYPSFNQAGALVHVYFDGSVLLTHGGTEMGQGLHTKMIQIASRVLDIHHSNIHITETSTDKVPNATTTAASFSSDLYGPAVIDACQKIVERIRPYKIKNPNNSWQQWIQAAYMDKVQLSATGFYKDQYIDYDPETLTGRPYVYYTYGAGCSEVEIDCLTGDHNVLKTDIVMDVGESLNPAIDIGQIEGAFVQGYGMFTMEEMLYSPTGEILTRGPGTYKLPTFSDIPKEFNVSLLKGSSNPRAVYSSKAIGEPPLCLASSVLFAIKEAVKSARADAGVTENFHIDAPATAAKIRMACIDNITSKIPKPDFDKYPPWNTTV